LITSSLFFILYFVSSAAAQRPENRKLNPQEIKDLGYDTGNPPGPYYKTSPDRVFELNGADGPQPPNGPGYAGVGCDSRQNPIIYSSPTADPSKFKSWESGSCMENGKPCCVNIDRAGYPIKIGDPRYVITDSQRQQCNDLDSRPPFIRREMKPICDFIAKEKIGTLPPGSPITGPGDSPAQAELARATAARQAAEQQLNNAQTTLASATAAQMTAEQQLATAQVTLASATEALQAAEQAVKQAAEQQAAKRELAERAVQEAEQQLTSVNMELETANSSLQLLEQQRSNAQEKVASLKARRDDALRILNDARAKVAQLTGMEFIGDIQDSAADTGTGSGSLPLKPGRRITAYVNEMSGGSGQQCLPDDTMKGSIPLQIICPTATSAEPLRAVLDINGGVPSNQQSVFAIKIKTGPSWDSKWRTRITLHPDRPAIDPSQRGRPVTAEIYLGFGVGPDETKFYPIKAEGAWALIKSIDGAVDIAELEIIEGCRQTDGTINRCPGRGKVN
jgi:hypothetical protein